MWVTCSGCWHAGLARASVPPVSYPTLEQLLAPPGTYFEPMAEAERARCDQILRDIASGTLPIQRIFTPAPPEPSDVIYEASPERKAEMEDWIARIRAAEMDEATGRLPPGSALGLRDTHRIDGEFERAIHHMGEMARESHLYDLASDGALRQGIGGLDPQLERLWDQQLDQHLQAHMAQRLSDGAKKIP